MTVKYDTLNEANKRLERKCKIMGKGINLIQKSYTEAEYVSKVK